MKSHFKQLVNDELKKTLVLQPDIIQIEQLEHLPDVVKNYLTLRNVIGQPSVSNFKLTFEGRLRQKEGDDWMHFTSVQYNFIDFPSRIFYLKVHKALLPAIGIHVYKENLAYMEVKLFGLLPIVKASGVEMFQSETVTFFNDICFFAPSALTDKRIDWIEHDPLQVEATFINGGIKISALLEFNEECKLINFTSEDRYETKDGKHFQLKKWSTPIMYYQNIHGSPTPFEAKAIYHSNNDEFCYGEFQLQHLEYNCSDFI